ncbi:MAG: TIGR03936 family radical SAM-associated protein [Coriobacteriia bacterium]|nr:TIGR03936 family radical SAM-associated protein [Coriobacteriia bacterium]
MSAGHAPTYRLRIEYAKQGRAAHLSHLEVIRALERIVRRATLPYAISEGFHPHIKLSFGPALGVGTASLSEFFDVILKEFIAPEEALARLQEATTPVLPILDCGYVSAREPSLSSAVTIFEYQVNVDGSVEISGEFPETLEVEQKDKIKQYDTYSTLPRGLSSAQGDHETIVLFTIRSSPQGTLRPDSLMNYLLGDDVDTYHLEFLRTATWVEDEDGVWHKPLSQMDR